ncbi:SufD family Fe-S cluster assembly protein [Pseudoramibacter faecis]|uniref:SufB/SufD family protein n=1 Tax=Pseudoramibacter faecis TaxID=3108534 RepID=UPI002E78D7BD|nr:SufD family Fe-S cluster assembly protein [Pseudoramibacter sp. HA2172]
MTNTTIKTLAVNHLPGETWNWLKMNDAQVAVAPESTVIVPTVDAPAAVQTVDSLLGKTTMPTGMGPDMAALVAPVKALCFSAAGTAAEPVRLGYRARGGVQQIGAVALALAAGSTMTVVMDYASDAADTAEGTLALQTKIQIGENARLQLVQIHRAGDNIRVLNDVGARCDAGGRLEVIHVIMGAGKNYLGCRADLAGEGSSLKADIGYLVENRGLLDMNYVANHLGKNTDSEINASGVLRDEAEKLFRGTIDFKRGCGGSVGNEKEDVLLMDDTVVNKTIPLILCAEEDVEGNHGATIGRLDDELLFYLESRGMNRADIYEMMAQSRIAAVCRLIPDAQTRGALLESLEGSDEA